MEIDYYYDLYISECWKDKKDKIKDRLCKKRLQPHVYIVTLSQGRQNQVEFFSSLLLKQHVFENSRLFVLAITAGYDEAAAFVCRLTDLVYRSTGTADIRNYVVTMQNKFEEAGENS